VQQRSTNKAGTQVGGHMNILKTYSSMKTQKHEFGNSTSYITTELAM